MQTLTPFFQYGSIKGVESASYSLSRGTAASVCTVTIPPDYALNFSPKPLVFSDGVRTVRLSNCIVSSVVPSIGADGYERWTVQILDRRWKWKSGQISGRYNIRHGGLIRRDTQKTVQELAKLCLTAMGEKNYDVKKMPNDTYPYIDWTLMTPNAALEQLCQIVNCHVCLNEQDKVVIWPDGLGKDLPALPSSSQGITFDCGVRPGVVNAVSAPAVWQLNFDLLAVGLDVDNKIKPVWELSYIPEFERDDGTKIKTWAYEPPPFMGVAKEFRKLAQETVWRWYQILPPGWVEIDGQGKAKIRKEGGMQEMPWAKESIKSVRQFFPLLDHQLDYAQISHVDRKDLSSGDTSFDPLLRARKPAQVLGLFDDGEGRGNDNGIDAVTNALDADKSNEPHWETPFLYPGGFSIDQERGLVIFSDPVFRLWTQSGGDGVMNTADDDLDFRGQAQLYLRVACNFYDLKTNVPYRVCRNQTIKGAPDPKGEAFFAHEDVTPEFYTRFEWNEFKATYDSAAGNISDSNKKLDYYLGYTVKKFETRIPAFARYPWLQPYAPDGLIAQVNFEIDGEGRLSTTINREKEGLSNMPSYDDRRQAGHLKAMLKRDEELKRKPS